MAEHERTSSDRVLDAFQQTYREDIRDIKTSVHAIAESQSKAQEQIDLLVTAATGNEEAGIDGYGKRLKKIENWKSSLAKTIGIIAGIALVLGALMGFALKSGIFK